MKQSLLLDEPGRLAPPGGNPIGIDELEQGVARSESLCGRHRPELRPLLLGEGGCGCSPLGEPLVLQP